MRSEPDLAGPISYSGCAIRGIRHDRHALGERLQPSPVRPPSRCQLPQHRTDLVRGGSLGQLLLRQTD